MGIYLYLYIQDIYLYIHIYLYIQEEYISIYTYKIYIYTYIYLHIQEEYIYVYTSIHASMVAQLVKNSLAMQETWVQSLGWKIPWRRGRLPTPVFWPGEFHGLYSPWDRKESDMTE